MFTRILSAWAVLVLVEMMGVVPTLHFKQYGGTETTMKPSLYNRLSGLAFFGSERQIAAGAILGQETRNSALA